MADHDLATFLDLEHAVWRCLATGDAAADRDSLTADFLGVYPTGFAGRDDHVDQLRDGPTVAEYALDDARLVVIGGDAVLLVYRATYRRVGADGDEQMYVSSLWCRSDGTWRNTFSQDTPAGAAVV